METRATNISVKSSSPAAAKIDGALLTFWLIYLSTVFGVVYTFICVDF
jgi:hypothetical protein